MGKRQARFKRLFLRNHAAVENGLEKAVQQYFTEQADAIGDAIVEHGTADESAIDFVFRPVDWDGKLITVVKPHLLRAAGMGAIVEYQADGISATKDYASGNDFSIELEGDDDLSIDIPPDVMRAIQDQLQTTLEQPYWLGIQQTTRDRLKEIFEDAAQEGDSIKQIAATVRQTLGRSKARSLTLARTETTGMMNAGHYAARADLLQQGYVSGSEWVATEDGLTRPAHATLDGVVTASGQQFDVGGEHAPYPGYYGLSARQRVHCRCTTVASFGDDDD